MIEKLLLSNSKIVLIKFDKIDNLEISSTDSNEIKITSTNEFGNSANFILEENDGIISVRNIFLETSVSAFENKLCVIQPEFTSYKILIPKNRKVHISIEDGNINAHNIIGVYNIRLERGNIDISNLKGEVFIEINIGNVNCFLNEGSIKAKTNLGFVKSDLLLEEAVIGPNELVGTYKNPTNKINIKAIRANIFFTRLTN